MICGVLNMLPVTLGAVLDAVQLVAGEQVVGGQGDRVGDGAEVAVRWP